jgi:uncharacterized protein with ParB-like and HNH nuclease domain
MTEEYEEIIKDDLQLEKVESELKDEDTTPLNYDIAIYPADFTLEVLYQKWRNGEIIIPAFQRGYVWTLVQASRLIESFMMGLPIPPIFVYIQSDQKYLVIDGLQRIQSVFYFLEGFFGLADNSGKRRVFRLEGINSQSRLYKKTFEELDETDQRRLKNSVLRVIQVKQMQPTNDDTSVYHIFERLNTGGTTLKDQEVRNCVYAGKLNSLLLALNEYENWRNIIGKPKLDSRQKDVQLILRYMALFHNSSKYQKPMKDFLSKFMSEFRNPSDEFLKNEELRFKKTCDLLIEKLGTRPFNPKGPMNASFFDSAFIAFAKNSQYPSDIQDRMNKLKNDVTFQKFISDATTDREVVLNRLVLAEKILFK